MMHRFWYYVDNFGVILRVGCGRCVMACPLNLDIGNIVTDLARWQFTH